MRRRLAILIGWFLPLVFSANPVVLEPSSLLAFWVVAFWAVVVEAGVVARLLTWQDLHPMRFLRLI